MLVEDSRDTADMLAVTLKLEGHDVAIATGARAAIAQAQIFEPDVAISNLNLNDSIDGVQVCKSILKSFPDMKVVILSGLPAEEVQKAARNIRHLAVLIKPHNHEELIQILNSVDAAKSQN